MAELLERRRSRQVTFDNAYFRGEVQAEPGEEVVEFDGEVQQVGESRT